MQRADLGLGQLDPTTRARADRALPLGELHRLRFLTVAADFQQIRLRGGCGVQSRRFSVAEYRHGSGRKVAVEKSTGPPPGGVCTRCNQE